jgi:nicotinate phosphoribosyltransferase
MGSKSLTMKKFHAASAAEVAEGKITDVYFRRTLEILQKKGINPAVKAEVAAKGFPHVGAWSVFAGLEEALSLLETLPVKVRALEEGSVFYPGEPVMEIEGRYQDFCVYETAVLGLLCQATGIATQAARFKKLAGERLVASFGARRMHPAIAPMIERSAFIGGCDGVSVVKSGELVGQDPMGTVPHALILIMGSTVEALKAYDEVLDPGIKRVVLVDTFNDEKFECLSVAEALGRKLYAVRFDTPRSRRGDLYALIEEARWELQMRGHGHVKIFVSGGLTEEDIVHLNPVADAYGIGTALANSPVVDFSMDLVEIEGRPAAKRGKWSGSKRLLVCAKCGLRAVLPAARKPGRCECGGEFYEILKEMLDHGKLTALMPSPAVIRDRVLGSIESLEVQA